MSVLHQKIKLPNGFVKIAKGEKVLFLNPTVPDWVVVNKNGAAILQLCNGKRTVEDIAESLSKFWRKGSKEEILDFFQNIISTTNFFTDDFSKQVYEPNELRIIQLSLVNECNLNCIYCYATDRPKSSIILTRKEHFKLIGDINAFAKH